MIKIQLFLKSIMPRFAKDWIYEACLPAINWQRDQEESKIPTFDLLHHNIKNLQILLNRTELLKRLPKKSICAEIGVDRGDFSEKIIQITQPAKLHLIDQWGDSDRYHDGLKNVVLKRFEKEINQNILSVNIGKSVEILKTFPENYFDWVYLDTDHSYDLTSSELNIIKNKMKPGGIIAGHDYIIGNWKKNFRYGVIEAVHELCVKEDWEIIYLTINTREFPSFAIRKI